MYQFLFPQSTAPAPHYTWSNACTWASLTNATSDLCYSRAYHSARHNRTIREFLKCYGPSGFVKRPLCKLCDTTGLLCKTSTSTDFSDARHSRCSQDQHHHARSHRCSQAFVLTDSDLRKQFPSSVCVVYFSMRL